MLSLGRRAPLLEVRLATVLGRLLQASLIHACPLLQTADFVWTRALSVRFTTGVHSALDKGKGEGRERGEVSLPHPLCMLCTFLRLELCSWRPLGAAVFSLLVVKAPYPLKAQFKCHCPMSALHLWSSLSLVLKRVI